jgi:hypothetical protein
MNNLLCKCTINVLSKDNTAKQSEVLRHITAVGIINWAVQYLKQNKIQLENNNKKFWNIPPIQANEINQALDINWVSTEKGTYLHEVFPTFPV